MRLDPMPKDVVFVNAFIEGAGKTDKPIRTLWEHKKGQGQHGRQHLDLSVQEAIKLRDKLSGALSHFQ